MTSGLVNAVFDQRHARRVLSEIRRRLSGLDPVPRKIKRMVTDVVTGRERAFDAEHIRVGRKKVLRIRVGGSVAKLLAALREMDAKQ